MFDANLPVVSPALAQTIEDAVLLGGAKEIGDILELIKNDLLFPSHLRYGLESLYYFRAFYGKGGELEPRDGEDKKQQIHLEALWGRELIESLKAYAERKDYSECRLA